MRERIATIVLLIEDTRQENLIKHYLKRCGHNNRNLRVVKSPTGRGSGEQFVRERYATEVHGIRAQIARTKACLITMIDADTGTLEFRRRQFEKANEVDDYRNDPRVSSQSARESASELFSWTRPNAAIPDGCVPSLRDCLIESDRLPA